jgi:riboflavin biosynthesis pyrimidine reductase
VALVAGDLRPPPSGRPWVIATMVTSADGSAVDRSGVSGGLGGAGDRAMFAALRAVADVIVAGAATVVAEDYGPSRSSAAVRRQRLARGQSATPRVAVLTGSLGLDPAQRLFAEATPDARPLVLTTAAADPGRRRALERVADVHVAGDRTVDWHRALALLRTETGASVVLCEGGPRTIGQLVEDDLLDELCLTVAPVLVAGDGPRIALGPSPGTHRRLELARVVEADGDLLVRYVRAKRP